MADYLVVVESPTKAKTIKKYLGRRFRVAASLGHVIDLPRSQLGIDIENNFTPKYITIRGKGEILKALRKEAKNAKKVLLATDPDREGEAISWHLAHALGIGENQPCRVEFHEITASAVKEAFKKPRPIDLNRVNAQQARRVLDRLVGYKISPLLWKKVKKGLSAGRVQSVALRLIVEREDEITAFVPEEYWTLEAQLAVRDAEIKARYFGFNGKKSVPANEAEVRAVMEAVESSEFQVAEVRKRERRQKAAAPFTTSSLQQEAARKLGFTARKTMQIAQQLYEGLPLGPDGVVGLITYMRTDAVRVSPVAVQEARAYITAEFGKAYMPVNPPVYRTKKGAQEAHEAIRPTSALRTPAAVRQYLSRDQYRLYKLIWERFLASQMSAAVYDTVTAKIMADKYEFRASGSQLKFDGFMKLYTEGNDGEEQEEGALLPELAEGELLTLKKLLPEQHFTQPPPPYSEALLVRMLEEKGIGRPSTYAPIIETLQARGYVVRENKVFRATELGRVVLEQLLEFFPEILDVDFTAQMELELDRIAAGELDWVEVIRKFYDSFVVSLRAAEEKMEKVVLAPEESDETCPNCGRRLVYKMGRYGKFLACPGFPECRYAKPVVKTLAVDCPECGKPLVERRTKRGRLFYGCSGYPACSFTTWDKPQAEKCPLCGYITVLKGKTLQCANSKCGAVIREAKAKIVRQEKDKSAAGEAKSAAGRRGPGA